MGGLLDLSGALHPKAYGGNLVGIATQKLEDSLVNISVGNPDHKMEPY